MLDQLDLHPHEHIDLPAHYDSYMTTRDKIAHGRSLALHVTAARNLTPVAASVTGSRLRGTDTLTSDVDGLVLVSEKLPKALSIAMGDVEMQVQSISAYAELLSRSVPYLEFQRSPFRLTASTYAPFLDGLRVDLHTWAVHAQSFASHVLSRTTVPASKRARTLVSVWHMITTGSPLTPRRYTDDPSAVPVQAREWIAACVEANRNVNPDELAEVLAMSS